MRSLATWCVRHRLWVIVGWLVALVGTAVIASAAGGNTYKDSFKLSGTESAAALNLLQRSTPQLAGDTEQIVFGVTGTARLSDPAVKARILAVEAALSRQAHVSEVTSVFSLGQRISADGRIGYGTATFDRQTQDMTAGEIHTFVQVAKAGARGGLTVAVAGQLAERDNKPSLGGVAYGAILAAVVLLLVFGSLFAMALPLVSALLALGTAFQVLSLLSHVMHLPEISPQLTALVGLGVGVDYALFIVTRHRQGLIAGRSVEESVVAALNTSGRAVLFAGIIVCVALLGMFTVGVGYLNGLAIVSSIGVLFTMLAALTLIPALLSLIGHRVLSPKQRRTLAKDGPRIVGNAGFWPRWADLVKRRPVAAAAAGLVIVLALAIPFASMRVGRSDEGNDPKGQTTRIAYDLLSKGFGKGFTGPLQVVGVVHGDADRAALQRAASALAADRDVAQAAPPVVITAPDGSDIGFIDVFAKGSPQDKSTTDLIHRLRTKVLPPAVAGSRLHLLVGGSTALFADFSHVLAGKLVLFVGVIVLMAFVLLSIVFRSIVIPLTAAAMNLLSAASAFGIIVMVFQFHWGGSLIGVDHAGPIDPFLPVMMFAILFGLSMDYEVFLVARMHEEWVKTGDNEKAVRNGLATTGKTITAAALIMILVFASFMLGDLRVIKEFGLAFAGGIFVDAFVIRSAIIPSVMLLVGRSNWWFPAALDRRLPHLSVDVDEPQDLEDLEQPIGV